MKKTGRAVEAVKIGCHALSRCCLNAVSKNEENMFLELRRNAVQSHRVIFVNFKAVPAGFREVVFSDCSAILDAADTCLRLRGTTRY